MEEFAIPWTCEYVRMIYEWRLDYVDQPMQRGVLFVIWVADATESPETPIPHDLTYFPQDKMAAISQTVSSVAFSWMKSFVFWLKFHWRLFLRVQWTINQRWFRKWLGVEKATSHYLNQCWSNSLKHICGTRGRWFNSLFIEAKRRAYGYISYGSGKGFSLMTPGHYLNQRRRLIHWTLRIKAQWNWNQKAFIMKNIWKCRLKNVGHFVQISIVMLIFVFHGNLFSWNSSSIKCKLIEHEVENNPTGK